MARILVLSFYYEPDFCAGSFRNTALVHQLAKQLGDTDKVDVLTTLPNRYSTCVPEASEHESFGNVEVWRVPVPLHQSGMVDQSWAFGRFAKGVWKRVGKRSYDVVYASSSRLMTAVLGALIAKRAGARLYLDMRDMFTTNMRELLKNSPVRVMLPVFRLLEKWTIRGAERVNLVSPGFVEHFRSIDPRKDFQLFMNGIDDEFIEYDFRGNRGPELPNEILYAGNIGEGQGLHRIIPHAAMVAGPDWRFRIVGDGGMRRVLEEKVKGKKNVVLEPPMPRAELLERYRQSDVLFLHLNDYPAFQKVLPSKVFEYGATGKPILAGVAGLAAEFVEKNLENAAVFKPCDTEGFVEALGKLKLEHVSRHDFVRNYRRSRYVEELASDLLDLLQPREKLHEKKL